MLPPPRKTVSEWADSERRLSPEASAEAGWWRTDRAAYQRGIMDAVNDPGIENIVIMSGAQIGKTEILLNILGYYISHDPSPILVLQPTLSMAQAFSKDRLAPMLRDTPCLKDKVKDPRSRDSNNTTLHKAFAGGHVTLAGSNSPASLASRPIRIVLADEVDRYPHSAGTEGDPVSLARKRSATFFNRKLVLTSTPTVKGASRIETAFERSDKRYFKVPCVDCDETQVLKWSNVQWPEDRPDKAIYVCEHCGSAWDDGMRLRAIRNGHWEATEEFTGSAGFFINGLYSPWTPLADAAREFLEARKLPEQLRVFVNTFLGETWEDAGEQIDSLGLYDRREDYSDKLPEGVVVLTAGVDVQDDRLEMEIVGWGRDEESWGIEYHRIEGDPTSPQVWSDLDSILKTNFEHPSGVELSIRAVAIDTGHHTQSVYNFVKPREGRRVMAIKGVGGEGRPLIGRPTKNNIAKVRLFSVGSNTVKEMLLSRLKISEAGPGYCHFPNTYDEEYFRQLTAEKKVTKYVKGFPRSEWVKTRPRNEALDVRCYSVAAYAALNTNINKVADRLRLRGDQLRQDNTAEATAEKPISVVRPIGRPQRRRASGYVSSVRNNG
jgi:phage terminase large subunit GpA-like protein